MAHRIGRRKPDERRAAPPVPVRVTVVTVSDSVFNKKSEDLSGPAVRLRCKEHGCDVKASVVVSDERAAIESLLAKLADAGDVDVIFTTGGTGLGPRDTTPEATSTVCQRLIPGFGEQMRADGRKKNPRAALSRAEAGIRGDTIIINLPGSPRGAVESLDAIVHLLPHAVSVLHGARHD